MLATIQSKMKSFWKDEEGLGMLEMIMIMAAIIIIALVFRKELESIIKNLLVKVENKGNDMFK